MKAEQLAQWRARGVEAKLEARAVAATTDREREIWSRLAAVHLLVARKRLEPEAVKGIAFLRWLHQTGRLGGPRDGAPTQHPAQIPTLARSGDREISGAALPSSGFSSTPRAFTP